MPKNEPFLWKWFYLKAKVKVWYNNRHKMESGGTESWYQLKHRLLVLNLTIA